LEDKPRHKRRIGVGTNTIQEGYVVERGGWISGEVEGDCDTSSLISLKKERNGGNENLLINGNMKYIYSSLTKIS